MALFIRDENVDRLVTELQRVMKTPTKKDAVRIALQNELNRTLAPASSDEYFRRAMALADAMGPSDHDVDMKKYMDDLWGDL